MNILYKYFSLENSEKLRRVKDILENNSIFLSSPSTFNDPFDCKAQYVFKTDNKDEITNGILKGLTKKYPERKIEDLQKVAFDLANSKDQQNILSKEATLKLSDNINKLGIFCLSSKMDNILLWAHYADEHRGICIGYDRAKQGIDIAKKVIYGKDYPKVDILKLGEKEYVKTLVDLTVFTKSEDWIYEDEYRIACYDVRDRLQRMQENTIKEIYLGLKMIENKEAILDIIQKMKNKPKVFQMRSKEDKFELYPEETII